MVQLIRYNAEENRLYAACRQRGSVEKYAGGVDLDIRYSLDRKPASRMSKPE